MYFLKTGSPAHLRWLRVFEPLMVITGIVQPLATLASISKLYFTHSQHASNVRARGATSCSANKLAERKATLRMDSCSWLAKNELSVR
jgi:hypothetical protein